MRLSEMYPSKYLSGDDLRDKDTGQHRSFNLSIRTVLIEEVGTGDKKETKPVIFFQGADKGMVLNRTNADHLALAYGEDTDHWIGKPVSLYFDPTVMFGRERTGGLRLQPMNAGPVQQHAPQAVAPPVTDHQAPLPDQSKPWPGPDPDAPLPDTVASDKVPF